MPTSCTDCCLRLGLFKKKRRCNRCRDIFCDGCFSKVERVSQWSDTEHRRLGHCMGCFVLFSAVINREDVRLLNVKHLKRFLALQQITTFGCMEKYHLIDLVMQYASDNGQLSSNEIQMEAQRRQEVESLRLEAIRRREEEENTRSASEDTESVSAEEPDTPSHENANTTVEDGPRQPVSSHMKSVEDIARLEDINGLTVMELKKILVVNFISYKGCFEKRELVEKVAQLWKEREQMTSTNNIADTTLQDDRGDDGKTLYDKDLCKVCMDRYIDCVFLDCGHLVACAKCGRQLAECPVCRQLIVRVVHIFRA